MENNNNMINTILNNLSNDHGNIESSFNDDVIKTIHIEQNSTIENMENYIKEKYNEIFQSYIWI